MAKSPEFYPRFVVALYHRGKAKALPLTYLQGEAEKVLKADELELFLATLARLESEGAITRQDDKLVLDEARVQA